MSDLYCLTSMIVYLSHLNVYKSGKTTIQIYREEYVFYEESMNAPQDLTTCHGVSLEGGLVLEKVAAVIFQFSPVFIALNPD